SRVAVQGVFPRPGRPAAAGLSRRVRPVPLGLLTAPLDAAGRAGARRENPAPETAAAMEGAALGAALAGRGGRGAGVLAPAPSGRLEGRRGADRPGRRDAA